MPESVEPQRIEIFAAKKIYSVSEDEADAIGIGKYASEIHGAQHQISNWE